MNKDRMNLYDIFHKIFLSLRIFRQYTGPSTGQHKDTTVLSFCNLINVIFSIKARYGTQGAGGIP